MIVIDGSEGEGGGQVLRSSLTLSAVTGQPFTIRKIRAGRAKPGLLRQHLTAVRAAAEICGGKVPEATGLGSRELEFYPGSVRGGSYSFAVGTAGSAMLVLQTILLPLLLAADPSRVVITGGTHNPAAPPFEFVERCYLPILERMGAKVDLHILKYGFMPAGGGKIVADITPVERLTPIELMSRGEPVARYVEACFANLVLEIAERELAAVGQVLSLPDEDRRVREVKSDGPGNAVMVTLENGEVNEVTTAFGMKSKTAEAVAGEAAHMAKDYLAADVAVGVHLADQIMLPMALAGGGRFTTLHASGHARTNADTISRFLPVTTRFEPLDGGRGVMVEIG